MCSESFLSLLNFTPSLWYSGSVVGLNFYPFGVEVNGHCVCLCLRVIHCRHKLSHTALSFPYLGNSLFPGPEACCLKGTQNLGSIQDFYILSELDYFLFSSSQKSFWLCVPTLHTWFKNLIPTW